MRLLLIRHDWQQRNGQHTHSPSQTNSPTCTAEKDTGGWIQCPVIGPRISKETPTNLLIYYAKATRRRRKGNDFDPTPSASFSTPTQLNAHTEIQIRPPTQRCQKFPFRVWTADCLSSSFG